MRSASSEVCSHRLTQYLVGEGASRRREAIVACRAGLLYVEGE